MKQIKTALGEIQIIKEKGNKSSFIHTDVYTIDGKPENTGVVEWLEYGRKKIEWGSDVFNKFNEEVS